MLKAMKLFTLGLYLATSHFISPSENPCIFGAKNMESANIPMYHEVDTKPRPLPVVMIIKLKAIKSKKKSNKK